MVCEVQLNVDCSCVLCAWRAEYLFISLGADVSKDVMRIFSGAGANDMPCTYMAFFQGYYWPGGTYQASFEYGLNPGSSNPFRGASTPLTPRSYTTNISQSKLNCTHMRADRHRPLPPPRTRTCMASGMFACGHQHAYCFDAPIAIGCVILNLNGTGQCAVVFACGACGLCVQQCPRARRL